MVLPLAGNPTSNLSTTSPDFSSMVQALLSSTSCPHRVTLKSPLFPEPFAWNEYFTDARAN